MKKVKMGCLIILPMIEALIEACNSRKNKANNMDIIFGGAILHYAPLSYVLRRIFK